MADFNEYSQKGNTLMQQALRKLAEGNIEAFEKDRKEANRYFDLFYKEVNSENGKLTQLYGESRNFGIIYNIIEQNINGNLYKDAKLRKIIKEMYDIIKSDKILNEQFKIYDFFEKTSNVDNAEKLVEETLPLVKHFNKEDVKLSNEKLIQFIQNNNLNEYVTIAEDVENLYEAIEYVMLNKKTFNNAVNFLNAQKIIAEHLGRKTSGNLDENKMLNQELYKQFEDQLQYAEQKLDESINDDEKHLLDLFVNPNNNHRQIFENYRAKTLARIKGAISDADDADKGDWKNIYESISAKKYSDKITENLINCAEMMEICSTIDE